MKTKINLLLTFLCLLSFCISAQTTFEKTYGGIDSDVGYDVSITNDGGFIITGFTYSFGSGLNDCYLVKTDNEGNFQWQKTYGGVSAEFGISILQNINGDYIIGGTTTSLGAGSNDYYVIKTDNNGDTIWTKTYGGWLLDSPRKIIATNDNGYAIIGRTQSFGSGTSSVYFVKIDSAGTEQFSKTYGGSGLNWGMCIQQTSDGGYVIVGKTTSFSAQGQDVYLIKTNSSGDTTWTKYFGSVSDDWANYVVQTSDNGYLITGTYNYNNGSGDVYITKTDVSGNLLWSKTYGSSGDDFSNSEIITNGGDYMFVGATNSFGAGNYDLYLLKTDVNGDTLWTKTFGGSGLEAGYSVKQTIDGGYVIVGQTSSIGNGSDDVYLIKVDNLGNITGINEFNLDNQISHMVYPNPLKEKAKIVINNKNSSMEYSLILYDLSGKKLNTLSGQKDEIIIERGNILNGIYFYKLSNESRVIGSGKLIIE